jgi:hypothetical protein
VSKIYDMVRKFNDDAHASVFDGTKRSVLPPRLDLRNHSPTGFEWGYAGSGPAQLALALLADATGDDELALKHYQTFKHRIIASKSRHDWSLTQDDIISWVEEQQDA